MQKVSGGKGTHALVRAHAWRRRGRGAGPPVAKTLPHHRASCCGCCLHVTAWNLVVLMVLMLLLLAGCCRAALRGCRFSCTCTTTAHAAAAKAVRLPGQQQLHTRLMQVTMLEMLSIQREWVQPGKGWGREGIGAADDHTCCYQQHGCQRQRTKRACCTWHVCWCCPVLISCARRRGCKNGPVMSLTARTAPITVNRCYRCITIDGDVIQTIFCLCLFRSLL